MTPTPPLWHVVAWYADARPEDKVWTLSRVQGQTGWETDSGHPGYGLTKADAQELADAIAATQPTETDDMRSADSWIDYLFPRKNILAKSFSPLELRKTIIRIQADARMSPPEPRNGWQPIETARRDGSHIQLYRPDIQFVGYWGTPINKWVINAPGLPLMIPEPTMWKPLAASPKETP